MATTPTELEKNREQRRERARQARREISGRLIATVTTALALVAALFWQTAITDAIKATIPVSGAWPYEIGVALIVTILVASTIYYLTNLQEKEAENNDKRA